MNDYLSLACHIAASLAISAAALAILSESLGDVLRKICPDDASSVFWRNYSTVMLTAAPLAVVLLTGLVTRFNHPADALRAVLIAALAGLVIGLRSLDARLSHYFADKSAPKEPM